MKIVYLSHSTIPSHIASSVNVMKMCQAFVKNGHDLVLLTPSRPGLELKADDVYGFYGVEPCFEVRKLPWLPLKGRTYVDSIYAALQAKCLAPDIVYGRNLQACFFCGLMKIPAIYEAHLLPIDLRYVDTWMHSSLLRSAYLKRLVFISNSLKQDYLQKYFVPEAITIVAHDAADDFQANAQMQLTNPYKLRVGYIGNLYPGKGVEIILEMAVACSWADFHIIGGLEADVNYWKSRAAGLDNVFFHGFIPHGETDRYRQACDVLIAPYQQDVFVYGGKEVSRWMSPLKLFEYMAAGKAILASNLPVLQEVLEHGLTALLCDPTNVQSWIEGLSNLRSSAELRLQLGKRARAAFEMNYTWQSRASRVLSGL
jgi:glycosyltransferase involved in cell wall biosynthesis